MKKNDYYVGLDIGTDSVGWAVADADYKLIKSNRKDLWGVRQFDEAKTAAERRGFRAGRRRRERRKDRTRLLQELFNQEICRTDPEFFLRIKESKFYEEDKKVDGNNTLFNDANYKDADYHNQYPTIYHLRKALIEENKKFDLRLVYLAIEHIIKKRGHFLFEGQDVQSIQAFEDVFNDMFKTLSEEFGTEFVCSEMQKVGDVLKDKKTTITNKKKMLKNLINSEAKEKKEIISLLVGGVVQLKNIFPNTLDDGEIKSISFSTSTYDEKYGELEQQLGEKMYIIDKLKAVYDWAVLADILKNTENKKYISYAKVNLYKKHKKDLAILKSIIKKHIPEKYNEIFKDNTKDSNYTAYVGVVNKNKNQNLETKKVCTQEDLCKYLKGLINVIQDDTQDFAYAKVEIENGTFLPKQRVRENGTIPYQVHEEELRVILDNVSSHYDFLREKDEEGYTVKDKILKVFKFRIPYYVGPLNDAHKNEDIKKGNCWIVKKDMSKKIKPWNFEEVVDLKASAENFILRMTNKCTYLVGEDVLPKNSLLYTKYTLLNELNNLKINDEEITVDLKKKIYKDLFLKYKKVTLTKLKNYLTSENIIEKTDKISGIDGDFKGSLAPYIEMQEALGSDFDLNKAENIIKWITLFGDDKKLLKSKILDNYALSGESIKKIIRLKYSGWGRLSESFLTDIKHIDRDTEELVNIIDHLFETNNNLMQLLSGEFDFLKNIESFNLDKNDLNDDITYEKLDELYVSPSVKRSIWQTVVLIKEITKVMKGSPKKIFIEMARSKEEKKRTVSRKDKLIDLYKKCGEEANVFLSSLEAKTDADLRSKKLYLYYTQMGKCMYTNHCIDLDNLFNKNIYDIDHIYPQSKVKDDSLDNMVLVEKTANSKKSDDFPIPSEYRQTQLWKMLYSKNLISKIKYDKLMRTIPFKENELADFIARQLVETRQSTKAVANILKTMYKKSQIVYVKAKNISDFRNKFEFVKVREINDFHHAKDAYLSVVVGNVYNTKFTNNPLNFIKNSTGRDYNLRKMYDFDVARNGLYAWNKGEKGTISQVKRVMASNSVLVTRYSYEAKGGFYDQTLKKKGKGQFPIKSKDPRYDIAKYGGYNNVKGAYFFLVEHKKKDKKIRTIEFVPIHMTAVIKSENDLTDYCVNTLNLQEPRIVLKKIKINTLFKVDGFLKHLSSRTNEQLKFKGAVQLILSNEEEKYIKSIVKYVERNKMYMQRNKGTALKITEFDNVNAVSNIKLYDSLLRKVENTIYASALGSQIKVLNGCENKKTGKYKFQNLSLEEQCIAIYEVLHLFQCNSVAADLTLLEGAKSAGVLVGSNDITKFKDIKIINQSPTGIYEQEIDVKKL